MLRAATLIHYKDEKGNTTLIEENEEVEDGALPQEVVDDLRQQGLIYDTEVSSHEELVEEERQSTDLNPGEASGSSPSALGLEHKVEEGEGGDTE